MEPKRNRSYSSQRLLAALLIILALSSQFRVAAMQASSENVHCSGSVVEFSVIFSLIIALLSDRVSSKTNECNGSIAECSEEYEFLMPSDISKRFLEEKRKYISPGALKPNRPVCNGGASGQSYSSSCLPPPSNPPSRGCSKYYRCRSDN
ncbi:hypothetical protein D5086_030384 [Populus alba]|uniref:Uncharacterized protein n=1 Tax=Populus alba TaxID=43335 RepID=A0ACC4ANC0_POPAL